MIATRPCPTCGKPFEPRQANIVCCSTKCSAERSKAKARALYAATFKPTIRNCQRCGKPLEALTRNGGNRKYCAEPCAAPTCEPVVNGVACLHCGTLFQRSGRKVYCGSRCRVEHFKERHDDEGEEIPIDDIEQKPRRLALARLVDHYSGTQYFDLPTSPRWVNPADRRASK